MAVPASFPESNAVLGKPPGMTADECEALSIVRVEFGNSMVGVVSCWKLTVDELALVNRTGRIWLTVLGETMPPVMVNAEKPF